MPAAPPARTVTAPPFAEAFARSCSHGLAMLLLDGPLRFLPVEQRDEVINRTLSGIIHGLVAPS